MTKLAFYAPLKPPDDQVPSGDRTMARALLSALAHAGIDTDLASRFRSREPMGDLAAQKQKMKLAEAEIETLIEQGRASEWRCWLTYHNYYKAPDLIGPAVSKALGIPYFLVEATRARKRFDGPWDLYARAAEAATEAARCVFYLTEHDAIALRAYRCAGQRLVHLQPFLPRVDLPPASECPAALISVGMFRKGDKLASYQIIAHVLEHIKSTEWTLKVVGDGPERRKVAELMSNFGDRVSMVGALGTDELQTAFQGSGILLWPGVNEAFGMVYLEAQAAGVVAVAQDRPGVRDVLAKGLYRPRVEEGPQALAEQVDALLGDKDTLMASSHAARQFIQTKHLLPGASSTLGETIKEYL